jgi:hypothetical protein
MRTAPAPRLPVAVMFIAFLAAASPGLPVPGSAMSAAPPDEAVWTNTIHTTVNGSTVTKTSGIDDVYNASAITEQALTGNGRFRFSAPTSVSHKVGVGLSADPSANMAMPFAVLFGGTLAIAEVREAGIYKGEIAWQPGDEFEIEVFNGNQVRYAKNGAVFYTSQAAAVLPLQLDAIISTLNASVADVAVDVESTSYDLRSDTLVIGTGPAAAPAIGPAGDFVIDDEFGTRITRVTDAASSTDGRSWGTPSAPNANAISSDDRKFYAMADDGSTALIFDFDPATGVFSLNHEKFFFNEPTFSRKIEKPNILYSAHYGYTVVAYNAQTKAEPTTLITLTNEVGSMDPGTQFVSAVYSSQGTPERIAVSYGAVQETHPYMTVFDADNPANRVTINTRTSQLRVNGGPWQPLLTPSGAQASINFGLHSISIDRSGTWVKLDISGNEGGSAHTAFFNVETRRIHEWTSNAWLGHYSMGWEAHVSCIADPNGGGTYQWLFTDLTQPGLPPAWRALITPPPPANNQITTDHTSWNNARADALVPVISGTQRGAGSNQWGRWFDEIVAVATDPNAPAQVYRAGRHYIALYDAEGHLVATFRDSPRPQVTHDGMWTFFTSNWGFQLDTPTSTHRRDLFVVHMTRE